MEILRNAYIDKLLRLRLNGRVKIITGARRAGKSYLLRTLYHDRLLKEGVETSHIVIVSLEDYSHPEWRNPLGLDAYIRSQVQGDGVYYVFIDEIQNVIEITDPALTNGTIVPAKKGEPYRIGFSHVVLGLLQLPNVDLYVTGSNSRFLSKDILTEFRDRGDEIHVSPLSFDEFSQSYDNLETAYEDYATYGGMPLILSYPRYEEKAKYLENLYGLTYARDVIERNGFRNASSLDTLTKVLSSAVGSLINPKIIADTFASKEQSGMDYKTIESYLSALEDAYIIKKAERIDLRGRKRIGGTAKYYFTDLGVRNCRLDFLHADLGHVMENIIFNHLIIRGYNVEVGTIESFARGETGKTMRINFETDFVASRGNERIYVQSCYNLYDEEKVAKECRSLERIPDVFPKIIVTRQSAPMKRTEKGIIIVGIIEFLLRENLRF